MSRRIVPPTRQNKVLLKIKEDDLGVYVDDVSPPPFKQWRLDEILFDKQLKFVDDPRPFKVAVCSRRSGKTVSCAADLVDTSITNPGVVCLYITLSRNNAKKLIWPELIKFNRLYGLGGIPDNTELSLLFPNGSVIYCSGAKDEAEIEKFRGLALKKVYIDEAQSFRPYIKELIDDIISPALMDYAGTLCLIGTPGAIAAGYFAEVSGQVKDKADVAAAWSLHEWTFWNNPYIVAKSGKTHQELLDRELRRRGVGVDDPSIQREWFGKWVQDTESLWIRYNSNKNHFIDVKERTKYNYILGIDLGFNDSDALAVIAWSEHDPITYLVEELVVPQQGITELVEQIQEMSSRYSFSKMVIDQGGLGKKIAEEMRRRHHIPVQMADKTRKFENVAFLNDALRTSRFKAKSNSRFAQDSYLVEVDRSKSRPDKIVLSDKYHSDIIDAVLYAFKESPAFTYQAPDKVAIKGSPEWNKRQEDEMFETAKEFFEEQEAERERIKNNGYG